MSDDQQPTSIRIEVLDKVSSLSTAGLGLVAALAWNDAIKAVFDIFFPKNGGIIAQFIYAIILTILIVFITIKLGSLTDIAKKQLAKDNRIDKKRS